MTKTSKNFTSSSRFLSSKSAYFLIGMAGISLLYLFFKSCSKSKNYPNLLKTLHYLKQELLPLMLPMVDLQDKNGNWEIFLVKFTEAGSKDLIAAGSQELLYCCRLKDLDFEKMMGIGWDRLVLFFHLCKLDKIFL